MTFKVKYSGWMILEADNEEDIEELFNDDDFIYREQDIDEIIVLP